MTYHHTGLFDTSGPGRTDNINTHVPAGGYVIPADIVSALGQGNTKAGKAALDHILPKVPMKAGGAVPVVVAGGEYLVSPEQCEALGEGKIKHGHDILDALVAHVRAETVKKLKGLAPPKGSKPEKKKGKWVKK